MSGDLVIPDDDGSIDAAARHLADLAANPPTPPESSGTDLVPVVQAPEQHKARLASYRSSLLHHQTAVEAATAEVRRRADLARQQAMSVMADMKAQVARLEDGITAINLYLGRDEHIELLRGGDPAPFGTPVTVRQMVLSADQECLAAADAGGIDARDMTAFFDWLVADDAHVDQVLPEPKGTSCSPCKDLAASNLLPFGVNVKGAPISD